MEFSNVAMRRSIFNRSSDVPTCIPKGIQDAHVAVSRTYEFKDNKLEKSRLVNMDKTRQGSTEQ